MACGKSLVAAFLVAVTLSSMSLSLEARHLLHTTGQWSTPNTLPLPRDAQIGILSPRPNIYYPDYTGIQQMPIVSSLPDPPRHMYGHHGIGILGPRPNTYYPAYITPTPTPTPNPTPIPGPVPGITITPFPGIPNPNPSPTNPPFMRGPPPPFPLPKNELN